VLHVLRGIPEKAAAAVMRYAPIAVAMNEFYRKLKNESRTARCPAEEIREICPTTGSGPPARPPYCLTDYTIV
jgi:hypothetical protein